MSILQDNPEILEKIHEKTHTFFYSTSMLQGYTYLHIHMNALCPIALNVDFFRYSAIIIIVLKLNPCRSEKNVIRN